MYKFALLHILKNYEDSMTKLVKMLSLLKNPFMVILQLLVEGVHFEWILSNYV